MKFSDEEKANILQRQFSSIVTHEPEGEIPTLAQRSNRSISDLHTTEEMMRKELPSLNINKSHGPDELHPRILIELADIIAEPITLLYTKSILHGTVPNDWKLAIVTPIYKKGSRNLAENYRPISLISILSKTMESFVKRVINEPPNR